MYHRALERVHASEADGTAQNERGRKYKECLGRRRRNKPIVTPIHRFQSIENGPIQHTRRNHNAAHVRQINRQSSLTSTISNPTVTSTIMTNSPQATEVDNSIYLETSTDGNVESGQHSQLMRLGVLIKYGMWASFGLITVSIAVTKFFINHQGTFEMLLLCTLGMLSVGLLGSCILSACKTKATHEFVTVPPQPHRAEMEIREVMAHIEETALPVEMPANVSNQTIVASNSNATIELEQPPPPYHIAILLPTKEHQFEELPPPTYENAMR